MPDPVDIKAVISRYDFPVQEFMTNSNFYGIHAATLQLKYMKTLPTAKVPPNKFPKLNMEESLQSIVKYALSGLPDYPIDKRFGIGDTFVFGDVHGQLDLLIQNLYVAGLIDKKGNLKDNIHSKTIVQVGDTINRGPFSWETVVYFNILQHQAQKNGHHVIRLIGNHEFHLISHEQSEIPKQNLQQLIARDIRDKRIVLSYCDPQKRVICIHGGLQKDTLLKILCNMAKEQQYQELHKALPQIETFQNNLSEKHRLKEDEDHMDKRRFSFLEKETSSEKIYQMICDHGLDLRDISEWMNQQLHRQSRDNLFLLTNDNRFLFGGPDSIMETYRKANAARHPERMKQGTKSFQIKHKEISKYQWKPLQVTGHNPTDLVISSCGNMRGIKQNKANIFVDANLTRDMGANQAYLMIDKSKNRVLAVEMLETKEPFKLFTEDSKPFGLAMKVPFFKIRRLEGLSLHDHELKVELKKSLYGFITKRRQPKEKSI